MDSTFVLSIYTMLKKTGYIALATLLILTTVGFVISRHYCNGELVSIQVDLPADNCCDEDADNCCTNERTGVFLVFESTQPTSEEVIVENLISASQLTPVPEFQLNLPNSSINYHWDQGRKQSLYGDVDLAEIQSYLL